MNSRQIKTFCRVVECGSISKVAQQLYTVPQSLMQQLNVLEEELGFKLLIRSTRGVRPTPAGQAFYEGMCQVSELVGPLIARCRSISSNEEHIRIGQLPLAMQLPQIAERFEAAFPHIRQEYIPQPALNDGILEGVAADVIDLVEWIYEDMVEEKGLGFSKIAQRRYSCLVKPKHPLAGKGYAELSDLRDYPVGAPRRSWLKKLTDSLAAGGVELELDESNYGFQTIGNFCLNKNGIYLLLEMEAKKIRDLLCLPLKTNLVWDLGLVHRKPISPSVARYAEIARAFYRDALRADGEMP